MAGQSEVASLEELNREEAQLYLGGTILICIISTIGTIGNIHVLIVYICHMKQSNHRIFIICLAVLDLLACTVCMPFTVLTMQKPYTFYETAICKILTFVNFVILTTSAGVLVVISIDRYRKICTPYGKQISLNMAKAMCLGAIGVSLLLSWPHIIMYGSTSTKTSEPSIVGHECFLLEKFRDSHILTYYTAALLFMAVGCFIVLAVLYTFIGKAIWKQRIFHSKGDESHANMTTVKMSNASSGMNAVANFHSGSRHPNDSNLHSQKGIENNIISIISAKPAQVQIEMCQKVSSTCQETNPEEVQRQKNKFDRTKRTARMLLVVTITFFFSYVPFLILHTISLVDRHWIPNMSYTAKITFNTVLWTLFINNMANCIIYSFFDEKFRQELKSVYKCKSRRR